MNRISHQMIEEGDGRGEDMFIALTSGLLELDQGAAEVLGMEEQHGLAVGADLGFAIAEDARTAGLMRRSRAA